MIADLKGKTVLVMGIGVSGVASARLLMKKGASVILSDEMDTETVRKNIGLLEGGVECEIGGHTPEFCKKADMIVTSPGIDRDRLLAEGILPEGKDLIGELELGALFCKGKVVAVTGTNGKSTTTELIGQVLSAAGIHTVVCGNIGNPLSGEVDVIRDHSVAVVEVSSFQLETINFFRPFVSVLLNISEDHYERHGGYPRYESEKFKIFSNHEKHDHAVIHSSLRDNVLTRPIKSRKWFFGDGDSDAAVTDKGVVLPWEGMPLLDAGAVPLKGIHNLENVACASVVSMIFGVEERMFRDAVKGFSGLEHRFQSIGTRGGVEFIDDSKATNIDSTRRALESLDKKVVLIAGGRDKGGDYSTLTDLIRVKVKMMVLIGEAAGPIGNVFSGLVNIDEAGDMKDAVRKAFGSADPGDTVLLSPMCSSFDMFDNYKHRGEVYRKEVEGLSIK